MPGDVRAERDLSDIHHDRDPVDGRILLSEPDKRLKQRRREVVDTQVT